MSLPSHLSSIGYIIKTTRIAKGLTQTQLADEAGVRLATISDIEQGKANFQINTLVRIATALGYHIDIRFVYPTK